MAKTRQDWLRIQTRLRQLGFDPGPLDGIPGRMTRSAVRWFQTQSGLVVDGIVGPQTMGALFTADDVQIEELDLAWFVEAQRLLGVTERPGRANDPTIMSWAEALDLDRVFVGDDVPWCGLFIAHCVASTLPDEPLPPNVFGARQWLRFGRALDVPALGAVLVFWRGSRDGWKGHVGFCAGADKTHLAVLGGNQGNAVNIRKIPRSRLLGVRWPVSVNLVPPLLDQLGQVVAPETDGNEA